MGTPVLRTKPEHRVPLLLLVLSCRLCLRDLVKETLDRVPPTFAGPVFEFPALPAGRHLGWQQRGEVILPERRIDLSCLEKTLDMPCRVFHAGTVGGAGIYEIRMEKRRDPRLLYP